MSTHRLVGIVRGTVAGVVVGILAGCASGPSVRASTDPTADFGAYHSYGFVDHLGTDRGDYSTIVSRALKAAVSSEMERRGYRYSETPDLWVNFQAHTRQKQEVSSMPAAGGYYRGGYYYGFEGAMNGYGCLQMARDVTEGTLNIDIVDRARKQSVWEGVALGELNEARMREPEITLPPLVGRIFSRYPYAAGRGVAATPQP